MRPLLLVVALAACEKTDRCPDGEIRESTSGQLRERYCERGGQRDGFYEANDGVFDITGQFRGGVRMGSWNWVTKDLSRPTRFIEYTDGIETDTGGYWRGQYHGRFTHRAQRIGPEFGRWYISSDITYRCGRVVEGFSYHYHVPAVNPVPPDPPPPADCPP
jgi:hypothetical protein